MRARAFLPDAIHKVIHRFCVQLKFPFVDTLLASFLRQKLPLTRVALASYAQPMGKPDNPAAELLSEPSPS